MLSPAVMLPCRLAPCLASLLSLAAVAAAEEPVAYRCLADSYPDWITGYRVDAATGGPVVVMHDGSTVVWSDGRAGKPPGERIENPALEDMFAIPYPAGAAVRAPVPDEDPGRARVTALFEGLYGKREPEVRAALDEVAWLPHLDGKRRLLFNRRHGAAAALRQVSAELEQLPPRFHKFVKESSGTFNRRAIAGTSRPSAHSWGIAIDLNTTYFDYWRWAARPDGTLAYQNRIPIEIVRIFERHGFIWGGRWHHYDTMHFEYRPELLHPGCVHLPKLETAK